MSCRRDSRTVACARRPSLRHKPRRPSPLHRRRKQSLFPMPPTSLAENPEIRRPTMRTRHGAGADVSTLMDSDRCLACSPGCAGGLYSALWTFGSAAPLAPLSLWSMDGTAALRGALPRDRSRALACAPCRMERPGLGARARAAALLAPQPIWECARTWSTCGARSPGH